MYTQKMPQKKSQEKSSGYTTRSAKRRNVTQKKKSRASRHTCIKCMLCSSVFTFVLLADADWSLVNLHSVSNTWNRHSDQTMALLTEPLPQTASADTSTNPPASSKKTTDSGSDRQEPDAGQPALPKEPDSDAVVSYTDSDAAKQPPVTAADEQTLYSPNETADDHTYYSNADNQLQFSSNADSLTLPVPERLPEDLLVDTTTDDESTHITYTSGDWNLILVNPWNRLPDDYTVTLSALPNGHSIDSRCYSPLMEMLADCRSAGLSPLICSSYRSTEKQKMLFQERIDELCAQGYSKKDARIKAATSVARPGTSEHQLGLAVDIVDEGHQTLDTSQENTPVQQWLMENSWKYGFILRYPNEKSQLTGIIYEPWHYRYVGVKAAQEIYESGVCLEEYLETLS